MSTNLTIKVNDTSDTGLNQDFATVPGNYVDVDLTLDTLIWTAGSTTVADGQPSPSIEALNDASAVIRASFDTEISKCFLDDYSTGLLDEILGAGSSDDRYVFCFSFDGETATEPTLEAWDDSDHDSTDLHVLGAGTPADTWVRAIRTTDVTPGASWSGLPISGVTYKLNLNGGGGALPPLASGETSQEEYANIKITIPSAYSTPGAEGPVLTCRYSWM